jgi:hypothetical protein
VTTKRAPRNESRQRLTLDELRARDPKAYTAFMDFTEAQTMFWELSVGSTGDIFAEDWEMDTRVQWVPAIGYWQ